MKKQFTIGMSLLIAASTAFAAPGAKPGFKPAEEVKGKEVKEKEAKTATGGAAEATEFLKRVEAVATASGVGASKMEAASNQKFAVMGNVMEGDKSVQKPIRVDAKELFSKLDKVFAKGTAGAEHILGARLLAELTEMLTGGRPGETAEQMAQTKQNTREVKKFIRDYIEAITNPKSTPEDIASYKELAEKYFEYKKSNSNLTPDQIYVAAIPKDARERQAGCNE